MASVKIYFGKYPLRKKNFIQKTQKKNILMIFCYRRISTIDWKWASLSHGFYKIHSSHRLRLNDDVMSYRETVFSTERHSTYLNLVLLLDLRLNISSSLLAQTSLLPTTLPLLSSWLTFSPTCSHNTLDLVF